MKGYTWLIVGLLVLGLIVALVVPGMLSDRDEFGDPAPPNGEEIGDGDEAIEPESVTIAYVDWACATASTYLVKNILEQRMEEVDVEITSLNAGLMWQSVATASADFTLAAWLPVTHSEYFDQLEDQVVQVRENFEGARIGLVVPDYVEIDSIAELNDFAGEFGNRIVGIDAGAGIMSATNDVIEAYDLELTLVESSDAAMTAELSTSIQNEEWIVVTGWAPHWKFAQWDLKFLDDPEGIYGEDENIYTITREEFATDNPRVQQFLENYFLTAEQLGSLMLLMEDMDNDAAAQQWMEENSDVVDGWLEGIQ